MFESVKKVIMENSKINEVEDEGNDDESNEQNEINVVQGNKTMKLMKKKSAKN